MWTIMPASFAELDAGTNEKPTIRILAGIRTRAMRAKLLAVLQSQPAILRSICIFCVALLACGLACAEARDSTAAASEKRIALVIGNAAYPGMAALKNPVNDAKDIAAKLRRVGFEVIVRTDARQKEMLRTLTEFGDKIQAGSEVLFFYAGHGMQVRGKNYLIPTDAEIRSEAAVSSEAIDVDQLLDKLAPARLSVIILDACRNNPFERRFRGGGQGLASINAPTGTLIAYSTAPGRVASDGDGRNGLYTQELLAAISVPGIKVEDVFKRVRANVVRISSESQVPWESSSLTGDFYFSPSATQGTGIPAAAPELSSPELVFWNSAERSNVVGDYEAYLRQFPDGVFIDLARSRIALLRRAELPFAANDREVLVPPKLRVGERWNYNDFSQIVEQTSEDGVLLRQDRGRSTVLMRINADGQVLSTEHRMANGGSPKVYYSPAMPVVKYPLKPGTGWREPYQTKTEFIFTINDSWEYEGKVIGWESVKVPAGSFDALRIDWWMRKSDGNGNQNGSYWYAPEVKGWVRMLTNGRGSPITSELLSFAVQAD